MATKLHNISLLAESQLWRFQNLPVAAFPVAGEKERERKREREK